MTDTSSLRAFIEARLQEDQERAERGQWTAQFLSQGGRKDPGSRDAYAKAIEREGGYSPARVLREVAAKRAILALTHMMMVNLEIGLERVHGVLAQLASVWSDHPDYRTEWGTP